ncbi:MAG: C39 family peptidase [Myxococcota bacterium]
MSPIVPRATLLGAAVIAVGLALALTAPAGAGEARADMSGGQYRVGVMSLAELRFQSVVKQQYDFSCGSAAVATLLTHHYGIETPESAVFDAMWAVGNQDRIREVGFSLLDMRNYLATRELRADGFRLTMEKLEKLKVPAIALIDTRGYKHFVVVIGVERGRVLVADPAEGMRAMRKHEFEEAWNGVLFVIRNSSQVARASFNQAEDWNITPAAPLGTALSPQSLGSLTIGFPGRGEF